MFSLFVNHYVYMVRFEPIIIKSYLGYTKCLMLDENILFCFVFVFCFLFFVFLFFLYFLHIKAIL